MRRLWPIPESSVPGGLSVHVGQTSVSAVGEKNCSDISLSALTVARCEQRPVGSMVRIRVSSDSSTHYSVCELRVFGRRFHGW